MKNMKKMLALLIAMIMVLGMSTSALAATADGTVTVRGIASGDEVKLYRVLAEDATSTTGWSLTSQFTSAGVAIAEILNGLSSVEAEKLAKEASLPEYTDQATGTSINFTVAPGLYLVVVTPADSNTIYNPAAVANDYQSSNTTNVIDLSSAGYSDNTVVKKATITVDKKAGGEDNTDNYSVGDVVPFTITTTMPSYPSNASNATMVITDTPDGLNIDDTSVVVKVGGTAVSENAASTFDATKDTNTGALTISFVKDYILANPGKSIEVSYNATLTTVDAVDGTASNTAKVKFNQNPNTTTTSEPSDTVEEQTYGIVFKKVDGSSVALSGAGFTLYAGNTAIGTEVTSGTDGYVSWAGLKEGTYTIVETNTPNGYVTANPVTITISAATATHDNPATANVTETNYDTTVQTITNNAGSELPSTGGMGTTLFYIFGAVLVLGAGVVMVTRRRMSAN